MNINKSNERTWFHTKARSRQCLAETMTDADYTDDLGLLTIIPAQAESLLQIKQS